MKKTILKVSGILAAAVLSASCIQESVPVGGLLVTNDISVVRGISTETAEKIKISDGCCWEPLVDKNEEVLILGVNGRPESIPRTELCDIIQPRVGEIFEMIREKISAKIKDRRLSGNVVLVGGGAKMSGVIELASTVFNTAPSTSISLIYTPLIK